MDMKTTRSRSEAKRLMWEYYRDNKEFVPAWIQEFREEIVEALIAGTCVATVFADYGKCGPTHT